MPCKGYQRKWLTSCHLPLGIYPVTAVVNIIFTIFGDQAGIVGIRGMVRMTTKIGIRDVGLIAFVAVLIFLIQASIKAANGEDYRYPLTLRFVS